MSRKITVAHSPKTGDRPPAARASPPEKTTSQGTKRGWDIFIRLHLSSPRQLTNVIKNENGAAASRPSANNIKERKMPK